MKRFAACKSLFLYDHRKKDSIPVKTTIDYNKMTQLIAVKNTHFYFNKMEAADFKVMTIK